MKLVVNNAPQPAAEAPMTEAELKLLAQSALVKAAKTCPRHVIVIADYGGGETAVWTSGLSRAQAKALAATGVRLILDTLP